MFHRLWSSGMMKQVDLESTQSGGLFLICPGPSLAREDLTLLDKFGIVTMGVNSSILMYRSHYWVTLDQPGGFPRGLYLDGAIQKFMKINTHAVRVGERALCEYPNMLFFGMSEGFTTSTLLDPSPHIVWWRNTFFAAIQIAYRLGFRRIHMLGVDLEIKQEKPYCHDQKISNEQVRGNRQLYNETVEKMNLLRSHFQQKGLEIDITNRKSQLKTYPFVTLKEAVERESR